MADETKTTEVTNLVKNARAICGCWNCVGQMKPGAHTIAGNEPREQPHACVAHTLLYLFLRDVPSSRLVVKP